ncbi:helix-turn-helix transcriptional regulator [Kitasatospora kifunensis]|uniref:DNA-binding CsgD family transcriptional regulator n=1 Tax=Kitasatospora kifunensis TaxID=58351 RepID=A0A7W7RB87_KITKI|nr:LuxR family transcriptional regulator [Kitasatospora kifunensis]MBB4928181.1 DNA-binding CsgD family transcriptional regulator [Kitasatospora kifunensis]
MNALVRNYVGRETEVTELSRLAACAAAGRGRAAFIRGGPGLGKTALLELCASIAQRLGMQVLHGNTAELEGQLPFAAVSTCLGVTAFSADPRRMQVADVMRGAGRYGVPGSLGGKGEADFATVTAFLALVDDLCAQGPVALLIDDLQWADAASVLVLHRLVRSVHELPLWIVGTYRPGPCATDLHPLTQASGDQRSVSIELQHLDTQATSAITASLVSGAPGSSLSEMVDRAAGNPLYIKELVAALLADGAIEVHDGIADLNPGTPVPSLTSVITHRLRFLSDEVLQALRVAAVLGSRCTATDLAAVLDMRTHDLLPLLQAAHTAGVLLDSGGRLLFRHDLIRHVLYDAIPGSARALLHLRAAQALATTDAPLEHIANHLLHSPPRGGDFLVSWLLQAAGRLTTRAPELTLTLLDQALDLVEAGDMRYASLQLHRAVALLSSGQLAEAEESARLTVARTTDPILTSSARWIIVHASFARGRPDRAFTETGHARSSPVVSSAESIRFHAFGSLCLLAMGDVAQATRVAAEAQHEAERHGDAGALAHSLCTLALSRFRNTPNIESTALLLQACQLAPATLHPAESLGLQLGLANCYIDLDCVDDARGTAAAIGPVAERTGGVYLPWYYLTCALLDFNTGNWDDALAQIEAGLEASEAFGMSRALRALGSLIALHRGQRHYSDLVSANATRDRGTLAWFYEYLSLWASALMDEVQGNPRRAFTRLSSAFDNGVGHLPPHTALGSLGPNLVRLALDQGHRSYAWHVSSVIEARAEPIGGPHQHGDAYRCQGLITHDPDLLVEAARVYQTAHRPLWEGHCYADAAEQLATDGRLADARAMLNRALDIYVRLGAQWDATQAAARLRVVGVRRGPLGPRREARSGWDSVTATEHIVAQHVAEGCSNPEIGGRMRISPRTVGSHVSSLLRKLGLTSRVELATEVIRRQREL